VGLPQESALTQAPSNLRKITAMTNGQSPADVAKACLEAGMIRTDDDHRAVLARASDIFDAEPGTPEGEELDALIPLIEAYEDVVYPIAPPTPEEAAAFRAEQEAP